MGITHFNTHCCFGIYGQKDPKFYGKWKHDIILFFFMKLYHYKIGLNNVMCFCEFVVFVVVVVVVVVAFVLLVPVRVFWLNYFFIYFYFLFFWLKRSFSYLLKQHLQLWKLVVEQHVLEKIFLQSILVSRKKVYSIFDWMTSPIAISIMHLMSRWTCWHNISFILVFSVVVVVFVFFVISCCCLYVPVSCSDVRWIVLLPLSTLVLWIALVNSISFPVDIYIYTIVRIS